MDSPKTPSNSSGLFGFGRKVINYVAGSSPIAPPQSSSVAPSKTANAQVSNHDSDDLLDSDDDEDAQEQRQGDDKNSFESTIAADYDDGQVTVRLQHMDLDTKNTIDEMALVQEKVPESISIPSNDWMTQLESPLAPRSTPVQEVSQPPMLSNVMKSKVIIDSDSPIKVSKLQTELVLAQRQVESMRSVVDDYEKAMSQMIEDARQDRERSKLHLEKVSEEKTRTVHELTTLETSFKDLRVRYEDLKSSNEQLRNSEGSMRHTIESLQMDIQSSEQRLDAVKLHAENKLKEANTEIDRLQSSSNNELALLRAKLQRSEAKCKTLERTVEQRQAENAELVGICDDLIGKMEGA